MLNGKQRHYLNALAHKLKPVVTLGNAGLTANVVNEIDQALSAHELIKVKINYGDHPTRLALSEQIAEQAHCEPVKHIGRVFIYYRAAKKPRIRFSDTDAH